MRFSGLFNRQEGQEYKAGIEHLKIGAEQLLNFFKYHSGNEKIILLVYNLSVVYWLIRLKRLRNAPTRKNPG